MSDINITYETLFELLRLEKNRVDLQKLDPGFYEQATEYVKDKQQMYEKERDTFSSEQITQQITQIANIKKILRDLFFRRIKKITSMALNYSIAPDSLIETDALLPDEMSVFEALRSQFVSSRKQILDNCLAGNLQEKERPSDNVLVRFLAEVPKFMGSDLEQYGPFRPEDMAHLPRELAQILIEKGNVEEINEA